MRICIITPGQPSTNPRVVKEADALSAAGHEVKVLCAHWVPWADRWDPEILRDRKWPCTRIGGQPGSLRFQWARLRHGLARRLEEGMHLPIRGNAALARAAPDLTRAAQRIDADLYIGHYPAGLAAAGLAAQQRRRGLAFDAEDYHPDEHRPRSHRQQIELQRIEENERRWLPRCLYVTAASPGIAQAYADRYGISPPKPILNVFPLADRPPRRRPTDASGPLRLYWFSQTIGPNRGLEESVAAVARQPPGSIELHLRGACSPEAERGLRETWTRAGLPADGLRLHPPASPGEMVREAARYDVGLAVERPVDRNRDICLTNKIFVYLLSGAAVLASATKAQAELSGDLGEAVRLFPPGDADRMAAALQCWREDRGALEAARRCAWERAVERYNWDIESGRLTELVHSVAFSAISVGNGGRACGSS